MKKVIIIAIAVVLCLTVVGGVFAMYKVAAPEKVISITAGGAATLTIGGLTGDTVCPAYGNTAAQNFVKTITLSANQNNLTGSSTLTIALTGDLAEALTVSFAVTGGETYNKAQLASGVPLALSDHPIEGTLTIAFDTNYNFSEYAELTATVAINYDYVDFAPVNNTWYLVGSNNGWEINSGAIALTDATDGDNQAQKAGVILAAGQYKAVKYVQGGDNVWASGDNITISTAGTYNIGVNGSSQTWSAAAN